VSEVLVLAAAGPGEHDGIGDYAWHLTRAFNASEPAALVIGRPTRANSAAGQPDGLAGEPRLERLESWEALRSQAWRARGDQASLVLVQFFPQAFVAPDFAALADWLGARRRQGTPVIATLHEYWPHASWSPTRELMRRRSRRAVRALADLTTAMVVSQPFSVGELAASGLVPRAHLHVIPVGSAIPRIEIETVATVARVESSIPAAALGMFGQPAMIDARAVRAIARWLTQAPGRPRWHWFSRSESELRRWWDTQIGFGADLVTFHGGLPADEISRRLCDVSIGLALYLDGASTRRSSLAALIEHRLPIAGLDGRYTDDRLRASGAFALVPPHAAESLPDTIDGLLRDEPRRAAMSAAAQQLYARDLAWPKIAASYRALHAER
jgi:glycosyltransferase involved in cell wall biosynthesis